MSAGRAQEVQAENVTVLEGGTAEITCRLHHYDGSIVVIQNPARQTLFFNGTRGERGARRGAAGVWGGRCGRGVDVVAVGWPWGGCGGRGVGIVVVGWMWWLWGGCRTSWDGCVGHGVAVEPHGVAVGI